MKPIHVGKAGRTRIDLDIGRLIDTRLLVCANSGAGKSYLLRGLAEQAAPQLPIIVLDPEGEFATLREGIDAVLVSRDGGDLRTDTKSAALLARKLLEMGLSAIIDLSDLKLAERRRYIRLFLDAVMAVPKRLWRPTLILLDESHQFCPQKGQSEAMDSVISLMSQGRKRGFCGVLATQRLSKLHKDAAAEANNMLIGRTTLDLDLRRACDLLQKGKAEWSLMQNLDPGEFFAFGPALSVRGITKLVTAKVQTSHPESGRRHALEAPKPSARIRKVLPEFDDLPERAAAEARTLEEARAQIRKLEREARKAAKGQPTAAPSAKQEQTIKTLRAELDEARATLKTYVREATAKVAAAEKRLGFAAKGLGGVQAAVAKLATTLDAEPVTFDVTPESASRAASTRPAPRPRPATRHPNGATLLGNGGKLRMMLAIAQMGDDGCDRSQLGLLAGMSSKSGTFSTYLGALRSAGYIADDGGRLVATEEGVDALGHDYEPLPTGADLADYWLGRMGGGGKRRMLEVLLEAGADGLTRQALADAADLSAASGTFSTYLGHLRSLKLVGGKDTIRVAETLR
jgi:hypothetical protein